ncbi:MAG: DCC1-like thiol-disulfide oxidoreductase family protein [Pseudomonadota bacterium]
MEKQVPATGLGLFRIFYGLVVLAEIIFLMYFSHLIFDPVPYLDREFPMIPFFLFFWALVAASLTVGYRTRTAALVNYIFWVVFMSFTPMARDFDGGFDPFMAGSGLVLIFLPIERALSIDNLRLKLRFSRITERFVPPSSVPVLAYYMPLVICLGLLYFDSAVHKLFAEHWRNGLGAWLPSSMPYYISAIDMSWLLNIKPLQMLIGYTIIVFQFAFIFLCYFKWCRVPLLLTGVGLHAGITLSFNIYPFGLGMLVHYFLMAPFGWWRAAASVMRFKKPLLTVFYDQQCPLCNRTVITVEHFDVLKSVEFKGLQQHAGDYVELQGVSESELLKDLFALDQRGHLYSGLDTYIQMLFKMRYTAPIAVVMRVPGIYQGCRRFYRKIADNRERLVCDIRSIESAAASQRDAFDLSFVALFGSDTGTRARRLAKIMVIILLLQLNSTIHYGVIYRLNIDPKETVVGATLGSLSNSLLMFTHTFLGITPHALYLHDHFEGYDHILAITYKDRNGEEKWLPFVNEEGRIVAPNWGRVHSMWANIAVTPNIVRKRLDKFIMKVTAFWGAKVGLNLNHAQFTLKLKEIQAPVFWVENLRSKNLAGVWRDIGIVTWEEGVCRIDLAGVDLEGL